MGLTNKNISNEKIHIINSMLQKDEENTDMLNSINLSRIYIKRDFDSNLIDQFYNNYFTLLEQIK